MLLTVLMMLIAMSLVPLGDTAAKLLMQAGVAPIFVGWSRFVIGALLAAPFAASALAPSLLRDWRIWLRGGFIVCGIACILTSLKTEPIANVFGAFFIGPILSFFLSCWLLGERWSWARAGLLVIGFMGVLLVVRPGFGMTPGLAFAVLAGIFYGFYLVTSRWLAEVARPRALLLSQLLVGAVILAPFGMGTLPEMSIRVSGLVLVSGAASMLGNFLLIVAYRRAEAGTLAPFVYFQLVAATFFGWFVFDTLPDALTALGLCVLVVAGGSTLLLRRG
ncbi:DMT family transporter [Tropicimonas sp. S265A]|uniref:DMT family transporter n=1 Tax=Tropicimonas sp. S265A TaxID=3415134 RepID=UPI003C7DF438